MFPVLVLVFVLTVTLLLLVARILLEDSFVVLLEGSGEFADELYKSVVLFFISFLKVKEIKIF